MEGNIFYKDITPKTGPGGEESFIIQVFDDSTGERIDPSTTRFMYHAGCFHCPGRLDESVCRIATSQESVKPGKIVSPTISVPCI